MSVWEILGIAPTADARAIKRAYAALLKKVHPEDDPEGFQRLREAYGEALELAKRLRPEEAGGEPLSGGSPISKPSGSGSRDGSGERPPVWGEANRQAQRRRRAERAQGASGSHISGSEGRDTVQDAGTAGAASPSESAAVPRKERKAASETDELIRQLEQVYADYPKRIAAEIWSELLENDRLRNLAFRQEVQPKMLRFLAEHPHLPLPVWQLLNRVFRWTDDELGLSRLVPPDFAGFILDSIRQPAELRFDHLPRRRDFEHDAFLSLRGRGAALLRSGRLWEAVEQFDAAYAMLEGGLGQDPDLLRLRATALHLLGEDLRAEEDWKTLVSSFPNERDALLRLADRLLETERASEALTLLQRALDLRPNDPQALLGLARAFRELGRSAEAEQICDLALLLEPSDIELRIRLLDLQALRTDLLLETIKRYPGDRDARFAAGELLFGLERWEECLRVLTEAPLYGTTGEMKALLGRTLIRLGREQEGARCFDEAVEAAETSGQNGYYARLHRGLYLTDRERWSEAEKDLGKAAALTAGGDARLWTSLARCAIGQGRPEEALDLAGRALRLGPSSEPYGTRAVALYRLRRYEEALEDFDRACAYRSGNPAWLRMKGLCEMRGRRYDDALRSLENAKNSGEADLVRKALCELYLRRGKYGEALAEARESEGDPELLLLRGWACRKLGRSGEAKEAFLAAAKLAPDDPRVLRFALDELAAGGEEEALAYAERILALDPGDDETRARRTGILFEYGRVEEAEAEIAGLLVRLPDRSVHPELWYYSGMLLLERKDYAAAAEHLRRACASGLRGDAVSLLSIALFESGMTDEALTLAREAAAEHPDHSDYRARLRRMEGKSAIPSALRQLLRSPARQESWPFSVKLRPVRIAPRDEPPYETEGMRK
ncbi:tetratricopeptide repeat protein [Saccharibacillus alkalitolerans]|uniref:Tetratricopeptide repeat protein n=1 Tax=Saccharibacillus alkalitolerans TaxID=2705290 RepID=A0ABX0F8L0_9BACL|nr:J domain-containing protein [Saccharibacillus alkalitolerans]NGZ74352.1 tetratricopeptide repeat protein [Saccharibacillus alkalitolerans]